MGILSYGGEYWNLILPCKAHQEFLNYLRMMAQTSNMFNAPFQSFLWVKMFVCPHVCSLLKYLLNVFLPPLLKVECFIWRMQQQQQQNRFQSLVLRNPNHHIVQSARPCNIRYWMLPPRREGEWCYKSNKEKT